MSRANREVIIIPASEQAIIKGKSNRQLRVAAYCRVSTDQEEQLQSYEAQKTYYTDLIMKNSEWHLAGIFADEGKSGANAEKRPDFMRMYRHCKQDKIDLIITKSISRFARNTLDSIGYVRKLKAMGIGVFFEKENINTLDGTSEVILTILSCLAQEELNSLSGNVKMGKRMAMKEGKVIFQYEKIYAYKKGEDGEPEIIPEEAEIIKRIFTRYLAGDSVPVIMRALNSDNIPSHAKSGDWSVSTLQGILENERFCGDVIMQKTYVVDPISKKVKKNNGELPKIYIKNNHDAIISRELFERVQVERARRSSKRKVSKNSATELSKYSSMYALGEILICGDCNTPYKRVIWTKKGIKKAVWRCISRLDYGTVYCKKSPTLDEESLHVAIVEAINATRKSRRELIPFLTAQLELTLTQENAERMDVERIEMRIKELQKATMELVSLSVDTNSAMDNEDKFKAMSDEMKSLHDSLAEYKRSCEYEMGIKHRIADIRETLESDIEMMSQYNGDLVRQIIDTIKVVDRDRLLVIFKDGTKYVQSITVNIRRTKSAA